MEPAVLKSMLPFYAEQFYNASALYLHSKEVKAALDEARHSIARILGVNASEISFVAGGTEANNLAIHGVMQQFPDANVVVSAIEHDSVLKAASVHTHKICPVQPSGQVDQTALTKLIDDETVLVSIMHANNETGAIQPIHLVSQLVAEIAADRKRRGVTLPLYLHTDASQSTNYLPVQPQKLGVDLMTINGGKIYGPKQTGLLYVRASLQLTPQLQGGGQEHGLRSGTENIAGAVGITKALEITQAKKKSEVLRLGALQELFTDKLTATFPEATINSHEALVNFVHVTFPSVDNERLVMELDERGIQCAVGSACSASSDEPSHVLKAMGLSDKAAQSSVRFTMGRGTTEEDIDYAIACLTDVVKA